MGLPAAGSHFPPTDRQLQEELDRYAAYYAGRNVGTTPASEETNLGTVAKPATAEGKRVKANICAEIAQTVATLTLGTGVSCEFAGNPENQAYVETLLTSGLEGRFLEAAETASAFGGGFLRLVADPTIAPTPYVTVVEPNRVAPEWVDGILVGATIWTEIASSDMGEVVRYVEYRSNRERRIDRALYVGNRNNWGQQKPLSAHPETAHLEESTPYPAGVDTMVAYWANIYPNRRYPWLAVGRSDFQGSESLLAAANDAVTEADRDLRNSRTRVIVPSGSLKASNGEDREIYTELDGVDPATGGITIVQGTVRSGDIQAALDLFKAQVVSAAGYAPQSFGLGDYGSGDSGTALRVRERRTISTTEAKRRLATPVIETVVRNLLALSVSVYGFDGLTVETPTVVWSEIVSDDPLQMAQSIQTLVNSHAISIETAVRLAQPDLDDEGVAAEVGKIMDENGLSAEQILGTVETTLPGF